MTLSHAEYVLISERFNDVMNHVKKSDLWKFTTKFTNELKAIREDSMIRGKKN
jgi:hypothetical protein